MDVNAVSPPLSLQVAPAQADQIYLHTVYFFDIVEEMSGRGHFGEWELMVILALMRLGDDTYGVPICREIEEQTGREVAVGSVYATLDRLVEKGFVSSQLGEPTAERGGRAKRYFRITPTGVREVRKTQRALMNLWNGLPQLERGLR
jgi:DNA-binding PadR family transcriptional regulator